MDSWDEYLRSNTMGAFGPMSRAQAPAPPTGRAEPSALHGDVSREHDRIPTVPRAGLDPVNRVEYSGSRTIARVFRVHALNVGVAGLDEKVHEDGLDGLGLVDDGLRSDLNTTDGTRVNVIFFQEIRDRY